jgi:hypothetical protein
MFRILIIVGLLLSGTHQSLARGNVELSHDEAVVFVTMDLAVQAVLTGEPVQEQPATENNPSYCKSSDCKAVIAGANSTPFRLLQEPDWGAELGRLSVPQRLEPRPPNS